jgi:hypothetical protein
MPQKINMILSNGYNYRKQHPLVNIASLGFAPMETPSFGPSYAGPVQTSYLSLPKSSSSLNAPFIERIHNTKPGCGACGRH